MRREFLSLFLVFFSLSNLIGQGIESVGINTGARIEKDLELFADSLNNYSEGELPSFLKNQCFDWQRAYWEGLHSPISVRWQVLKRVDNKQALKSILKEGRKVLRKKCELRKEVSYPYLKVPDIGKSFFQLIKRRYKQLH